MREAQEGASGERRAAVVIAGLSVRAAAESAARAGYAVTAVDAFGDLDLEQWARVLAVRPGAGGPYRAGAAARLARTVDADAAAYAGGFENHPAAVRVLAEGRALWGNWPATLARVRNPATLARTLRTRGFAVPAVLGAGRAGRGPSTSVREGAEGGPPQIQDGAVRAGRPHHSSAEESDFAPAAAGSPAATAVVAAPESDAELGAVPSLVDGWLLKRRASGGGRGVSSWAAGTPVPRGAVLQERIAGVSGSVAFVADGRSAVPFALSRQIVGEPAFGASGFHYCGSILAQAGDAQFEADAELYAAAVELAAAVAAEFGLVGLNCVDFVARAGTPYAIEVNPRYSASMELAERAYGLSVFDAHARACGGATGTGRQDGAPRALPAFDLRSARRGGHAVGKAVVYARAGVTVGDTRRWLEDDSVRDVPRPGERIAAGRPVCTVFAEGRDAAACRRALVARARRVYDELEGRA